MFPRLCRCCRSVLALLVVLFLGGPSSPAAVYHVGPGGKDTSGGSATAPWATLQQAAGKVGPGDTVMVHKGTYAGFDLRTAGTKDKPITFKAEEGVVVNARNPRTPDGINIEGAGFIVLE